MTISWVLLRRSLFSSSSVKAAADQVEGDILTEEVVPSPKGPYREQDQGRGIYSGKWPADNSLYIASLYDSRAGKQRKSEFAL